MRISRRIGMLVGIGVLALGVLPAPSAGAGPSASVVTRSVTLVTGDRVVLQPDGSRSVRPAAGRDSMSFITSTNADHAYVVPADAAPLVASGRLDSRLFDVNLLLEYGYDDTLPLIVTYSAGRARSVPGGRITRALPAVDGVAVVTEPGNTLWGGLTASGVDKVWLDGKRQSTLDRSVPQIGAPTAWAAGYTGAGVTVAVLDTGVNQAHPDLAGREIAERNFSSAPDNTDVDGHGTHVASIIASTDSTYRGVASGVSLLDGKVLDDSGYGQESEIIAGMQWAAEQGATIANLSLGGTDTPEVDPLEEAVNTLSEEYGILFVIAAGNSGGDGTVGSPGSADAALTVGAVDRQDNLAPFSSRGPRVGDRAIKPDLTAPGVEIVAAANSGGHIAMSGTSMAAPHVAGAAALLAQRHPDWTGAQLKAALTGSAKPTQGLPVFAQGTGRVDVAVTGDTTSAADGDHTGVITATAGESTTRTPVAITREPETYRLTVNYLDLDGKPNTRFFSVLQGLDNWTHEIMHWADVAGTVTLELPPGHYALDAMVLGDADALYYLPYPSLTLTEDTTITVDPRTARPVDVTPPVAATLGRAEVGYQVMGPVTGLESGLMPAKLGNVFTAQSGPPSPAGTFAAYLNSQWMAADTFYGLAWSWEDALPTGVTKVVRRRDLATVRMRIGGGQSSVVTTEPDPFSRYVNTSGLSRTVSGAVTWYVTTGARWTTTVSQDQVTLTSPPRTYRAGRGYEEQANRAVFGPTLPAAETPWVARYAATTRDDLIFVNVPLFGDSGGNAGFSTVDSASTALYLGDELIDEIPELGGAFSVPDKESRYRLTMSATRGSFDVSRKVSAEWTFRSAAGPDRYTPIDMSVVRFTPTLDDTNSAPAGRTFLIPVALQRADGTIGRPRDLTVAVSYDEGRTWRPAAVLNGKVRVHHPADATSVSLRAFATDRNGNTVRQTIIRAYQLS